MITRNVDMIMVCLLFSEYLLPIIAAAIIGSRTCFWTHFYCQTSNVIQSYFQMII